MIKILIAFLGMFILIGYSVWELFLKKQKSVGVVSPFTHKKKSKPVINKPHEIKGNKNNIGES